MTTPVDPSEPDSHTELFSESSPDPQGSPRADLRSDQAHSISETCEKETNSDMASRNATRDEWQSVARGWRRWEPYFAACTWPVTLRLMQALRLGPGMRVLDVGSGIGDPSLSIASAVGPAGHVLSLDFASEMVEVARIRAQALGITNVEYRVGALEEIEVGTEPFEAVVTRFTLCLLTDPSAGLSQIRRMLVPGGRIAIASWVSTDVNRMFGIPREQLAKYAQKPRPSGDTHCVGAAAPGPLRFAKPGRLESLLEHAGFDDVRVTDVYFYNFARDPEEYFNVVYDTAVTFRRTFDGLTPEQQGDVRESLMAAVAEHETGGVIRVPAAARVASAILPAG